MSDKLSGNPPEFEASEFLRERCSGRDEVYGIDAIKLADILRENERLRETLTIIDMQALNVMQDDVPPYGAILKCGWVHEKCKEALSNKESV